MEANKDYQEIDVAKIMEKIREGIQSRKSNAICLETEARVGAPIEIEKDLEYINANWEIQNSTYFISSHRPVIGKPLAKMRELVHGEVRRYVDPVIFGQNEFNASTVRLLNDSRRRFDGLEKSIDVRLEETLKQWRRGMLLETAEEMERTKIEINEAVGEKIKSVVAVMNKGIEDWPRQALLQDRRIESSLKSEPPEHISYLAFEERFRGSREDIKMRQTRFVRFFELCDNVLDIGCGRGEFLELLKEKGIGARGVDIDEEMVAYCRSRDLNAEKIDALTYLEGIKDQSLDGLFLDQVVEHLEPEYLMKLLSLSNRKLKHGHFIIIETVNPLSLFSLVSFYIDLSHKRPLHPDTLEFILKSAGFKEVQTEFLAPVPEDKKLTKMSIDEGMDDRFSGLIDTYNRNIDKLNNFLYGPQDYVVTGRSDPA